MKVKNNIDELINADIISVEIGNKILEYYKSKESSSSNRLLIVFGILGAILVGLGVILIIAHNWDNFPRSIKTIFAFIPLIFGQLLCLYGLLQKNNNKVWKESSSAFLFFSVGASISLVSQIYHIQGGTGTFILTWMILCLPIIYLMKSSIVSLLYLMGITYYAIHVGYFNHPTQTPYYYILLMLGASPYYFQLYKKRNQSNFFTFHNWVIAISLIIVLTAFVDKVEELILIAYFSLLSIFYTIGNLSTFKNGKVINNSYKIIGSLATIFLLIIYSFNWFWKNLLSRNFEISEIMLSNEFVLSIVLSVIALILLVRKNNISSIKKIEPISIAFLVFILAYIIGLYNSTIPVLMINIFIFILGIITIKKGVNNNHLGILNFGLLTITTLVISRFFDTNFSFIVKGILFLIVGISFFAANYLIIKKRGIQNE